MLDAARAVFAERGFRQATLEEIAERAEFGKGTLYNYFEGGKEEILFAVLDEIYDDLEAMTREKLSEEKIEELDVRLLFEDYIRSLVHHFLEERELLMLIIKEAQRLAFDEEAEKVAYFRAQNDRIVRHLLPPIREAIERGALRDYRPEAIAHSILGNVNGCLMKVCSDAGDPDGGSTPDRDPDRLADFLTTMLFDGLLTRT